MIVLITRLLSWRWRALDDVATCLPSIARLRFYNSEEVSFEWAWACLVQTLSEAEPWTRFAQKEGTLGPQGTL